MEACSSATHAGTVLFFTPGEVPVLNAAWPSVAAAEAGGGEGGARLIMLPR